MYLGEIVEIGPRAAVLKNPQHPYTRKLMSAVPQPDPARRRARQKLLSDEVPSPVRPAQLYPAGAPLPRSLARSRGAGVG